jgi:hypothetical protein
MRYVPVIALFLLGSTGVFAQSSSVLFSFKVEDYPESQILESLLNGHRSEVRYEFRIFRRARGLAKIFGDKLIKEEERLYIARWDALDESFVVLVDQSTELVFNDAPSFLDFFLSIDNRRMFIPEGLHEEDYLLCRWRIQPIKLVPPLTLMTFIKSDLQTISPWRRTVMEKVAW